MDESKVLELSGNIIVGLITGGLAILGIHLTNRHNLTTAKNQRVEEAEKSERDRKLGYKKEVYFEAVNDMARLIGLTQRLADNTYPESEFAAAAAQFGAGLNRVNLIAGEATLTSCSYGNVALATAVCEIMKERLFLKILQSKIDAADKEFWSTNKEIEQVDKTLEAIDRASEKRDLFARAVEKRSEILHAQDKFMNDASALRSEWSDHLWKLGPLCLEQTRVLNQCLCNITIAMRKEIDFSVSEKRFAEISAGTMTETARITQAMQADVKAIVADMSERPC